MNKRQNGAVSLFVVLFATLLITVITISFARLMTSDQQQATTADLSQSAYDSAQAGVEDAKRALLNYESVCAAGGPACDTARSNIDSPVCNVSLTGIATPQNGEVMIQQTAGDKALDQAYTCVTITRNTDDYQGVLQANTSRLIPLVGTGAFDSVLIEWYSAGDMQDPANVDLTPTTTPLLVQSSWSINKPSVMRAQIMQVGSTFKLDSFDDTTNGQSNANTLFLYPVGVKNRVNKAIDTETVLVRDIRKTPLGSPLPITCSGDVSGGGYACRAQLVLPTPVGGGNRTAFLRLSSLYNKTNFRVSLLSGSSSVQFNGVQPQIDSTGRANDLFRRVQSRIEFSDPNFPYPEAAVQITGNFCKNFLITNNPSDYVSNCTP